MATRKPLVIDANGHPAERPSGDFLSLLPGDFANQTANTFLGGPASGSAAAPAFRGLVPADLGLTSAGDILIVSGTSLSRLPIGTNGDVLAASSGTLTWTTPAAGGAGVSTVGLTAPSWLTVTNSPLTTAGTLVLGASTGSANTFLGGPTGGSAATISLRALNAADIPSLSYLPLTASTQETVTVNATGNGLTISQQCGTSNSAVMVLTTNGVSQELLFQIGTVNQWGIFSAIKTSGASASHFLLTNLLSSTSVLDVDGATNNLTFSGTVSFSTGVSLTLVPSLPSQSQAKFFASPAASSGVPSFRAIAPADVALTTTGDLLTAAGGTLTRLAAGSDGYVLTANSGAGAGLSWEIPLPTTLASTTVASSVSNTTSGTILSTGTASFAANALVVGQIYRVKWWGDFVRTGTPNISFTVLVSSAALPFNSMGFASNGQWEVECDLAVQATGTSGTVYMNAVAQGSVGSGSPKSDIIGAPATVDTTAAISLRLEVAWSVASTSDIVTLRGMTLERVA